MDAPRLPPCDEYDCRHDGEWEHDSGKLYCRHHSELRLMTDDREDFADEWAREDRRSREVA